MSHRTVACIYIYLHNFRIEPREPEGPTKQSYVARLNHVRIDLSHKPPKEPSREPRYYRATRMRHGVAAYKGSDHLFHLYLI